MFFFKTRYVRNKNNKKERSAPTESTVIPAQTWGRPRVLARRHFKPLTRGIAAAPQHSPHPPAPRDDAKPPSLDLRPAPSTDDCARLPGVPGFERKVARAFPTQPLGPSGLWARRRPRRQGRALFNQAGSQPVDGERLRATRLKQTTADVWGRACEAALQRCPDVSAKTCHGAR